MIRPFYNIFKKCGNKETGVQDTGAGRFLANKKLKIIKKSLAFCFCCDILISRVKEKKITGKKGGAVMPRVERPTGGITNPARYFFFLLFLNDNYSHF